MIKGVPMSRPRSMITRPCLLFKHCVCLIVLFITLGISSLFATDPEVSNVTAAQRTDGSKIVDIWYDLAFTDTDSVYINLQISEDGGIIYTINPAPDNLSGDIRYVTQPGSGKHIIWNMGAESRSFDAANFVFHINASSYVSFEFNSVFAQGGTFNNGTSDVTISSFYIAKYEVTQLEYQTVMGTNPAYFLGILNRPVERASWFDAIEYCNRLSMRDGLNSCYSYTSYGSNPDDWPAGWNTSNVNHNNLSWNRTANGYRLPTEMEWMYIAKGGSLSQGFVYSGSNVVDSVAWYVNNSGGTTHEVGELLANELGIYDMSGNVREWCWDIFGDYPTGAQINPIGPSNGTNRVRRGGRWDGDETGCTVVNRSGTHSTLASGSLGFRICRSTDRMILVEGGTFNNGTSNVTLSSFYIDKYELTQAQYQAVMGTNPSYFSGYPNRPVEQVSWFNAIEYCNRRSMQEGLTPCYSYGTYGTNPSNWPASWNTSDANHTNVSCNWSANGYRLPTEMEWMYAAKGGNQSQGYTYSGSNTIGNVAWYNSNSGSRTHDVGELASNELGTFDMSGNVYEWCWDIYGTYPSGNQTDPHGAASGSYRVMRGGGWGYSAYACPVSDRAFGSAPYTNYSSGFRCVRVFP